MSLFVWLHSNTRLHFLKPRSARDVPEWWKVKLLPSWTTQAAAHKAYDHILKHCHVHWEKVMHMCKAGTEYASAKGGLTPLEVSTMTKHSMWQEGEVMMGVYFTELFPHVLKVMAGFTGTDTVYDVAQAKIGISERFRASAVDLIFPQNRQWIEQMKRRETSAAAQDFLLQTLPFLANVVIQDGIYWIKDYPNHEVSCPPFLHLPIMQGSG